MIHAGVPRSLAVGAAAAALLALTGGCSDESPTGPEATGTLSVHVVTDGAEHAGAALEVVVDGDVRVSAAPNGSVTVPDLAPGEHTVELIGVPEHCTLIGPNPRTAVLARDATASIEFRLGCFEPLRDVLVYSASDSARGTSGIAVKEASGTVRFLTNPQLGASEPAVSPDGTRIAFMGYDNRIEDVLVMRADGSHVVNLTRTGAFDGEPAWSPDGTRIAFTSSRDGNSEIYVMNADGSSPRNLTQTPAETERSPAWSPDGTRIAFTRGPSGGVQDIWVTPVSGGPAVNLTHDSDTERTPAWSPDGSRIVFEAVPGGSSDLFVMDADGANRHQITFTGIVSEHSPAWAPDGSWIAYWDQNAASGTRTVQLVRTDGSGRIIVSGQSERAGYPAWAPAP
jgi:Tol biopolymer transport system component